MLIEQARRKQLRLYIEYPSWLPNLSVGSPSTTYWERAVVVSSRFTPELVPMRILSINDCHYVPVNAQQPEIVLVRVAGCDTAVYGLPNKKDVHPIFFECSRTTLLVAATKLSNFRAARYGHSEAWTIVWNRIIDWLCQGDNIIPVRTRATVHPTYVSNIKIPPRIEKQAFCRRVEWYSKAKMLIHPTWSSDFKGAATHEDGITLHFSQLPHYRPPWVQGESHR